jgi:hypothetical protein
MHTISFNTAANYFLGLGEGDKGLGVGPGPSFIETSRTKMTTTRLRTYVQTFYSTDFTLVVLDPEKGVCADPVGGVATLGEGGPGPPVGVSERQLSLDRKG